MAYDRERCAYGWQCRAVCPQGAILSQRDHRIDFTRCDACGRCAEACDHEALRLVGTRFTAETLVREIVKDRDFFVDSGGGVTLSGGEPMMHAAFLQRLLPLLATEGLHVAMQTCGMFPWARMEPLLPFLDLIQFDLKHMDNAAHERLTGVGNEAILENFAGLARSGVRLEARMPVIPGLNDDRENIRAMARFLARHGHSTLQCLAYHNLGEAKLPRLAPILAPLGKASLDPHALAPIAERFKEEGIDVALCP
jgi:pyruvate formate lyase activating enzyme